LTKAFPHIFWSFFAWHKTPFFLHSAHPKASSYPYPLNIGARLKSELSGINYEIDYNFSFLGELGNAHRVSLSIKFGEEENRGKQGKKNSSNGIRYFYKK
jgi:hypothetical protein